MDKDAKVLAAWIATTAILLSVGLGAPTAHAGAEFETSWRQIGYPTYTTHGQPFDTALTVGNPGDEQLDFAIAAEEVEGPIGWLTHSFGVGGSVSAGDNLGGTVRFNSTLYNNPGTIIYCEGRLIFTGNQTTSPDTLSIELWIADTIVMPDWDTLYSECVGLTVANNGNFGNQGRGKVNLDFWECGDCDDLPDTTLAGEWIHDTIPGESRVYLYDGSPVIMWQDAADTLRANWSIYGETAENGNGFYPWTHTPPTMGVGEDGETQYTRYYAEFVTRDSGIKVEQSFYAPVEADLGHVADGYMVKVLKIYANDGQTHPGLCIGDVIDWNVPADSGAWNNSLFDASRNLIYQQGVEVPDDTGDLFECQDNHIRYAGSAVLGISENGGDPSQNAWGMFTIDNASQVEPTGSLVPDSMWKYTELNEGYVISDSTNNDLHTVQTYRWDHTLGPNDTLEVVTILATSRDGQADFEEKVDDGIQFADCVLYGCDPTPPDPWDIADLVFIVNYMFQGGPAPEIPCWSDCDKSGATDIADLVYLVNYMFNGGPEPHGCD